MINREGDQQNGSSMFSPLLNDLSAAKWNVHDFAALSVLAVFLVFYFVFHGMYVNYIWGDFGRWHEEVRRFAQGEIPYRDFTWAFPPLAIYLYGSLAKVFGDSFLILRLISAAIFVLIALMLFLISRHCVPREILPLTVMACMTMGIGISNQGGESLGTGMYIPSTPLGILMSLLCLFASIRYIVTSSKPWLYMVAIGFAGAFLTKQDFWMPVLACVILLIFYQWERRSSIADFGREVAHLILPALGLLIVGYLLVIIHVGLQSFITGCIGGFGLTRYSIGRLYPTWRRIFDAFFLLSAFAALGTIIMWGNRVISRRKALILLIITCVAGLFFGSVRLGVTYWVGSRVASGDNAVIYTRTGSYFQGKATRATNVQRLLLLSVKHVILSTFIGNAMPLFMTVAAAVAFLWVFWKYRKSATIRVGVLLAVWVVAARMRRLFESADVIHLLVEPLFYVLAIQTVCTYKSIHAKRCYRLIFSGTVVFLVIGLFLFTFYDLRPRTKFEYERIMTEKGSIKIPADHAAEFRMVEQLVESNDPSGDSPILTGGYQGALNYMLNKRSSTPATLGIGALLKMGVSFEELVATVKKERPIIILPRSLVDSKSVHIPVREYLDLTVWEPQIVKTDSQGKPQSHGNIHQELLLSVDYRRVERPPVGPSAWNHEIYIPSEVLE